MKPSYQVRQLSMQLPGRQPLERDLESGTDRWLASRRVALAGFSTAC